MLQQLDDGVEKLMVTNGGALVLKMGPGDPNPQMSIADSYNGLYASLKVDVGAVGCSMNCRCWAFFSRFFMDCDGAPGCTCESCTVTCPDPGPPPPPPWQTASVEVCSEGVPLCDE